METITPDVQITYNGKDVTADLRPFLLESSYIDKLNGESDELEITLADLDGRWLDGWYPEKGAEIQYAYGYAHSELVPAGSFDVDEVEFEGPPTTVRIKALATGLKNQPRTRKGKAYTKTTLRAIIDKVAKRIKAKVIGDVANIQIPKATQYQETDWAFLVRICFEYGYQVKLTNNNQTLVVAKMADLGEGTAIRTIRPQDVTRWRFRDKISTVPAKTEVRHYSHRKKRVLKAEAFSRHDKTASDTRTRVVPAPNPAQHSAIAQAEQERHDIDKTSLEITLPGDKTLVAGVPVELAEWGKLNGVYLIIEARHPINRMSSFTTEIKLKQMKDA